jgi:FG-GAP-like repeat
MFAGDFQPPVNYSVNLSPTSIVKGDFNRDGNLDLVVTGYGDPNCTTAGAVIVLLGEGNGKFTRGGQFVAGPPNTTADTLATGDFNRDGTPDLVVVNNAINQFGNISILLGDGSGGFQPPVSYPVGGSTLGVGGGGRFQSRS